MCDNKKKKINKSKTPHISGLHTLPHNNSSLQPLRVQSTCISTLHPFHLNSIHVQSYSTGRIIYTLLATGLGREGGRAGGQPGRKEGRWMGAAETTFTHTHSSSRYALRGWGAEAGSREAGTEEGGAGNAKPR